MKAGELQDEISILELKCSGGEYSWEVAEAAFAKAERLKGNNIFSSVGLGARSVKFTIRQCPLSLHNAIEWNGRHCFLTDIISIDREYYEITAALIEPRTCTVSRKTFDRDTLNRLVLSEESTLTFPAVLTEKYLGHTQGEPMATVEIRYVLVTPKVIALRPGEIVAVDSQPFNVLLAHTLDEYKNEYEITRKEDV